MPTPVIDIHAHLIPPKLVETMRRDGARYGVEASGDDDRPAVRLEGSAHTRPVPLPLTRIDERVATLDRQGVDMQVCAGWVDYTGYTMPRDLAIKFSELQNELLAEAVALHPGRLVGAATAPLQDAKAAATVLERAVRELNHKSVQVGTYLGPDKFLDHPDLDPFWEAAQDMQVMVQVHPFSENHPAGLGDYFLHNAIGYPLQSAIAMARMMFSGVFLRFPKLQICFPHGGGGVPYVVGRLRRVIEARPEAKNAAFKGDPLEAMKGLWYDTITLNPLALRYLVDLVGADRLMMGTDYPFDMSDADPLATVRDCIPEGEREAVLGGRALRLFKLDEMRTKARARA